MNRQVENYIQNKIKHLERERQALAVMKENYSRSVKRTLEMLIYTYKLEQCVYVSSGLIGKLVVAANPYGTDGRQLPYILAFEPNLCPCENDTWKCFYVTEDGTKAKTITSSDLSAGFGKRLLCGGNPTDVAGYMETVFLAVKSYETQENKSE